MSIETDVTRTPIRIMGEDHRQGTKQKAVLCHKEYDP